MGRQRIGGDGGGCRAAKRDLRNEKAAPENLHFDSPLVLRARLQIQLLARFSLSIFSIAVSRCRRPCPYWSRYLGMDDL